MTPTPSAAVFRIPSADGAGTTVRANPATGGDNSRQRVTAQLWSAPLSVRVEQVTSAFASDGLRGLAGITGPWAVALSDGDTILAVHDPTGIMPLYWAQLSDGGVAVSDHLPTLVLAPGVDSTLEPDRIAMRYAGGGDAGWLGMSLTDYRHIHAVPPGQAIRVTPDGTVRQVKFWDPGDVAGPDESMSPEQAAQALRTALDGAVARAAATACERRHAPGAEAGSEGLAVTRIGAEWSPTTPGAVLAQAYLAAVDGGHLACVLGGRDTEGAPPELPPALSDVPFAPLITTTQMHEWTSALDYHRFPSRSRDSNVALALQARHFQLTDVIAGRHPSPLPVSSAGITAGLLAKGHWQRARAVARSESPTGGERMLRRFALGLVRDTVPESVVARLRTPRRWAQRARDIWCSPTTATSGDPSGAVVVRRSPRSPVATSLGREQARRYTGARSARDYMIASWMSGAEHRFLEATWSYLAYFGIRMHQPFLDVEVVETALRIPDSAWVHMDVPGWAYWAAVEPWIGTDAASRRGRPTAAESRLSQPEDQRRDTDGQMGEVRTWRENDPTIAAILQGRPHSAGPTIDPCDWGI